MNVNRLLHAAISAVLIAATGCQSWQGSAFPLQNATRVPPPGTGTYQLPSGYYNNGATSAIPSAGSMQTASSTSGLRPAVGVLPATTMPATNLAASSFSATGASPAGTPGATSSNSTTNPTAASGWNASPAVIPAGFASTPHVSGSSSLAAAGHTQAASSVDIDAQYTEPAHAVAPLPTSIGESSKPDGSALGTAEIPSLQWQQFGGQ